MRLADTVLPDSLSGEELAEALRALRGSVLRQEIYAVDGTTSQDRPYRVTERNYTLELLQPRAGNRHAVFFVHARETLDFAYERAHYLIESAGGVVERADPRVTHDVVLAVDPFGNLLRRATVGYGRRYPAADVDPRLDPTTQAVVTAEQQRLHVTVTELGYTNSIDTSEAYRAPLACESRTFELVHVQPAASDPGVTNLFGFAELAAAVQAAGDGGHDLPYEDVDAAGASTPVPYRRLLEHSRTLFSRDDLTGPLQLGWLDPLALRYERYRLALTPGLLGACTATACLTQSRSSRSADTCAAASRPSTGGFRAGDGSTRRTPRSCRPRNWRTPARTSSCRIASTTSSATAR
jgi:hypothetical protein